MSDKLKRRSIYFQTGDVRFESFEATNISIGTGDLRSSSVVLAASTQAATMALVLSLSSAVKTMMERFEPLHQQQKENWFDEKKHRN